MEFLNSLRIIGDIWLVFLVYWLISSFSANKATNRQPRSERLAHLLMAAIAIVLFSSARLNLGPLNRRLIPAESWIFLTGIGLTAAGVAFAIWARYHIGRYWSATVAIVSEHKLIRTGPYARIRHPIYTGIMVAVMGTALVFGRYRDLLGLAIVVGILIQKAKREEVFLRIQFGDAFEEHCRATGFLLPR